MQLKTIISMVTFAEEVTVHLVPENYRTRHARRPVWMRYARDRHRFQKRIAEAENMLGPVLSRSQAETFTKNICNTITSS